MKKGQLIAAIRALARKGEPFTHRHLKVNGATPATVQQTLCTLARSGELKVVLPAVRLPVIYKAGKNLCLVNTMQLGFSDNPLPAFPVTEEMPFKAWKIEEAKRQGITPHAIEVRLHRGKYPDLKLRRVTKRTIFVMPDKP